MSPHLEAGNGGTDSVALLSATILRGSVGSVHGSQPPIM